MNKLLIIFKKFHLLFTTSLTLQKDYIPKSNVLLTSLLYITFKRYYQVSRKSLLSLPQFWKKPRKKASKFNKIKNKID